MALCSIKYEGDVVFVARYMVHFEVVRLEFVSTKLVIWKQRLLEGMIRNIYMCNSVSYLLKKIR